MIHRFKWMKYTLIGFLLAFMVHANPFAGCNKDDDTEPEPNVEVGQLDVEKAKKTAEEVEKAFADANVGAILGFLTPVALERSGADIEAADPAVLKQFAEDFNDRKIEGYGTEFIEFSFMWNGQPYTVDFAVQEDGTFKVIRL